MRPLLLGILIAAPTLCATDFSSYRQLRLGLSTTAAAKLVNANSDAVRLIHRRPALMEEIAWRVSSPYDAIPDPVRDVLLRFHNGSLFQMVVTYDRHRVEGLTEQDLTRMISLVYGPATKPGTSIPLRSDYSDIAPVLAAWGDAKYALSLVRTGDQSSYALVLTDISVDALARKTLREAERLDVTEAPALAAEMRAREDEKAKAALDKARTLNLPNFKP